MKKTYSKKVRVIRNVLLLILLLAAVDYFSGLPVPVPEIQFRRDERAHLVGPGKILGTEEIYYSLYETMIVAETEDGVILWVTAHGIGRSDLIYREKNGDNLLLAAPGSLGYMTVADEVHLPLILFDKHPRAVRVEIQFTLNETIDGEVFEKTYHLSADRETAGYFLLTLNAGSGYPVGIDYDEALTLQIFANIVSRQDWRMDYSVPVQMWFYDGRDNLIAEETLVISGEPMN